MERITFRAITPIFRFKLQPSGAEFSHHGTFKGAKYTISLKEYKQGPAGFDELMKYANDFSRKSLVSLHIHNSYGATDYFLVIDVTQPLTDELRVAGNSSESTQITSTIHQSLQLHSSKGVLYDESYCFRYPPSPYDVDVRGPNPPYRKGGHMTMTPLVNQYLFSHLGLEDSVLSDSEFASCRATFNSLVKKKWDDSVTLDRVLQLALAYHRVTFNLEAVQHRFLILMIIFEALFKKQSESNAGRAAKRISKLVSTRKSEQKPIQEEFFSSDPNAFCRLRNKIAHGDPGVDIDDIKSRYPALHRYITKAIIELISSPDRGFDHTKDYYDESTKFIESRFKNLP